MCFEAGPTAEGFPADRTQPRLHLALLLQLGDAVGVQPVQVVLQIVAAVEAQLAQVAGERLFPRVDEGVSHQTRLILHHFTTDVTHSGFWLKLHRAQRCMLGVRVQLDILKSRGSRMRVDV